ncbi:hypothetical protein D9M68_588940 [compost metagenome]
MTMVAPKCLDMIMVSSRATLSVGPPAANGTTADTGLLPGNSWAYTPDATPIALTASAAATIFATRFMLSSPGSL